eukprot:4675521-Prymnesium_polylepis.1
MSPQSPERKPGSEEVECGAAGSAQSVTLPVHDTPATPRPPPSPHTLPSPVFTPPLHAASPRRGFTPRAPGGRGGRVRRALRGRTTCPTVWVCGSLVRLAGEANAGAPAAKPSKTLTRVSISPLTPSLCKSGYTKEATCFLAT